jgi:hypothetical protein
MHQNHEPSLRASNALPKYGVLLFRSKQLPSAVSYLDIIWLRRQTAGRWVQSLYISLAVGRVVIA